MDDGNNANKENSQASNIDSLYLETYPVIFDYILKKSIDTTKQDAQDLAQEAYLRLIRVNKKSLISHPKAYLFQIAANLINEHYARGNGKAKKLAISMDDYSAELADTVSSKHNEIRDALADLESIIKQLPPIYRSVMLLRKRDGLSHSEIALELGISIHTVRKYLTSALLMCRKESAGRQSNE